ncbi:MAG: polymer-forming cytoskeletal protein [Sphingobium sp.]
MFSRPSKSPSSAFPASPSGKGAKRASGVKAASFSVIGPDVVITGNISAAADLHIDGRVEGDIICAELIQGQSGVIAGQIEADSVRIAGQVNGGIQAGQLMIEATAHICGDVCYDSISVAPGAHVDGRFSHREGGQADAGLKLITNEAGVTA